MNNKIKILTIFFSLISFFSACEHDTPTLSLGIEDFYHIPRMKAYRFTPGYTGESYRWIMVLPDGRDSLLSDERYFTFVQKDEGIYNLRFEIIDSHNPYTHLFQVEVMHELVEYSPYISRVLEYKPAPGQFVNEMPLYEDGDNEETMRRKVEDNISGTNNVMVTLGGFGGYVTFGFDHTVINVEGKKDFRIYGNAFYELTSPGKKGGSCEPGIVMVAFDKNRNGKPDEDEWYELAGSEYYKPETIKDYEITFYRPDPNKAPTPDPSGALTDTTYIKWSDNQGNSWHMAKNVYHPQDYYPKWIKENQLSFRGTKLKNNAVDISGFGSYWVQYAYEWGYVDNHPNGQTDLVSFDIGSAVDKDGNKVHLPGVDFIRVYTALNQYCGRIGETSTEIVGAQDLHIEVKNEIIPNPLPDN